MSDTALRLGKRIRSLRVSEKISQEELAFKAGISTTYLGQIERAEKSPTVEMLEKISKALDISLYELFSFDESISASIGKINAQLSPMSDKELSEVLKVIKNIKAFKSI